MKFNLIHKITLNLFCAKQVLINIKLHFYIILSHWKAFPWASCQIRKIAGCPCAGNAGNVSLPPTSKQTTSWWCWHASRHVCHARALMHVGIANPRWRGKCSWHSWRMRNLQFYVSGKRPMEDDDLLILCMLMSWQCKEPGHQQPRYWPSSPEYCILSTLRFNL